jgi:phosphate uptake regulator
MERRKVQKIGPSSLCISLPKDWTSLVDLQPGDIVRTRVEQDKSLNVRSERFDEKTQTNIYSINADTLEEGMLNRLVISSYVTGANQIIIASSERLSSKLLAEIRSTVQRLIGANILEETEEKVVIDHFINESSLDIQELLKKQSILSFTMLNEAFDSLQLLDTQLARECIRRESEADSTSWLIYRLTYKATQGNIKFKTDFNPVSVRIISRALERVADCSEYLANITLSLSESQNYQYKAQMTKAQKDFTLIQRIFKMSIDSISTMDLKTANKACQLRYQYENDLKARDDEISIPHSGAIYSMLSMIAENSSSLAREVFNIEGVKKTLLTG